jgi:hypothetical protein
MRRHWGKPTRSGVAIGVLIVGLLTLSACGSGGSSITGGGGNGANSSNSIATLIARSKSAKYKVTYQSGTDAPFTIAQDPPRFSYVSGDSSTFVPATGSAVACTGSGSSATCTDIAGTGDAIRQSLTTSFGTIGAALLSAAGTGVPGLSSITQLSTRKIAGRTAECATLDSASLGVLGAALGKNSYSVCVDKQTGVMLQSKADSGNGSTTEIVATAFSTPTDADFTPPVTPITIPGLTPTS